MAHSHIIHIIEPPPAWPETLPTMGGVFRTHAEPVCLISGALLRRAARSTVVRMSSHDEARMNDRLSVPLPADLAAWLRREAERQDRPVAFVARKVLEAARRAAQADQAAA